MSIKFLLTVCNTYFPKPICLDSSLIMDELSFCTMLETDGCIKFKVSRLCLGFKQVFVTEIFYVVCHRPPNLSKVEQWLAWGWDWKEEEVDFGSFRYQTISGNPWQSLHCPTFTKHHNQIFPHRESHFDFNLTACCFLECFGLVGDCFCKWKPSYQVYYACYNFINLHVASQLTTLSHVHTLPELIH